MSVKTIAIINDSHIPKHDVEVWDKTLYILKKVRIHSVLLNGDNTDFDSVSAWDSAPANADLGEEIKQTDREFGKLRKAVGKSVKIFWQGGNHDLDRYVKNMQKYSPEKCRVKEYQLENILPLAKYNIKFLPTGNLYQGYRVKPFRIGRLYVIHGHEIKMSSLTKHVAANMLAKCKRNILFGHFHKFQSYFERSINGDVIGAWANGCMQNMDVEYDANPSWQTGFSLVHLANNGEFQVEQVIFFNGRTVFRGKII